MNTINRKLIVIALTVAFVFLVSLGSAWAAVGDCCPDGSQASKYPMRVYVYDKDTNKPVKNAMVTITGPFYTVTNYTAKNGWTPNFSRINVDGDYTITIMAAGYSSAAETHTMSGGDYICEPIIFEIGLDPPCEHSLQVCVYDDETNLPVSGASVTLTGPIPQAQKTTASNGCTGIFNGSLPTGDYTVNVTAAGYIPGSATATVSPDFCGLVPVRVDLQPCKPSLQVCVYNKDTGEPIPGASVTLTGPGSYSAQKTTGTNGCTASFNGKLKTGAYTAQVTANGFSSNSATATIGPDDCGLVPVRVELQPCKPSLQVCVYNAATGNPISGASVKLTGPGSYSAQKTTGTNGCTDSFNGNLQTGAYTAQATANGFASNSATATIGPNDCGLTTVRVDLSPCDPSLQVCVYDADTGNPISGANVIITGPDAYSAGGTTGANGCTGIYSSLKAGKYTVSAAAANHLPGSATGTISQDECGLVKIEIELFRCERSVQVCVRDKVTGDAIPGAYVMLEGPYPYTASDSTSANGCTGVFNGNLKAGDYTASATATNYSWSSATFSLGYNDCGQRDIIIELEEKQCEGRFLQIYVYSGLNPLSGASVNVTGPDSYSATDTTDSSGKVEFNGTLPDGDYNVKVNKSGYFQGTATVTITPDYCGTLVIRVNLNPCDVNCYSNSFRTYVYDEDTGSPIKSAVVTITGPSYRVVSYTDKKGWTPLIIGAKLPGAYTVTAEKGGYSIGSVTVQYEEYCGQQIISSIPLKQN